MNDQRRDVSLGPALKHFLMIDSPSPASYFPSYITLAVGLDCITPL
jgi:hypothetical protein